MRSSIAGQVLVGFVLIGMEILRHRDIPSPSMLGAI